MARPRYPKHSGPPPAALPPIARTVGQVIAETLKLYGTRFFACLVLGVPIAIADPLSFDRPLAERTAILVALSPLFSMAYAEACSIEAGHRFPRRSWLTAVALGTLVFVPAAATLGWFVLLGIAWLGVVGWVVPVSLHEELGVRASVARALALGRADLVHAVGSIAALVLVFGLTRNALAWLLREQAENTVRVSVFLADLVIAPVVFLGSAIVYRDLVARVGTTRVDRRRAREEALGARAE
jgi:hypothetical protein